MPYTESWKINIFIMLIHYIHYSSKIRHSFYLHSCPRSLYYYLHTRQVECYPMCFLQEAEIFGLFDSKYGAQLDGVVPLPALFCPSGHLRPSRIQGHGDSILSSFTLTYLLLFHAVGTAGVTWWKYPCSSAVPIPKHPADSPAGFEFSWHNNSAKELRLLGLVPVPLDFNFPQTCCVTHGRLLNLFELIFYT